MSVFSREFRNKLQLHLKDTTFTHPYEHLIRAVRLARRARFTRDHTGSILDVGAYDGKTSLFFHHFFPRAAIHAYEPNPEAAAILRQNVKGVTSIHVHPEALSDENGTVPFYVTHNKVSSSLNKINTLSPGAEGALAGQLKIEREIEIPKITLDSCGYNEILLLKLDTQGNEVRVLNGGTDTLHKTSIVITEMSVYQLYQGGCTYSETDALLRENGFIAVDFIVPSRKNGVQMMEFDAIYINTSLVSL
jgi:FkbM family methyltransferase